jgi:hypothetical protein
VWIVTARAFDVTSPCLDESGVAIRAMPPRALSECALPRERCLEEENACDCGGGSGTCGGGSGTARDDPASPARGVEVAEEDKGSAASCPG